MNSFIKASEVWVPNSSCNELELLTGNYGEFEQLHDVSVRKRFAFGAGLPGMAWAAGHPLLANSESGDFERSAVARSSGISHAIAIPVFAGEYLTGVLVLMLGKDDTNVGAFEIWRCDTQESYDLKLESGYFGQLKHFEVTARHTAFRQGTGLPGRAWEQGTPVLMKDLGNSHAFIRREGARRAGITTGLAFPVFHDARQVFIVAMLSSLSTPLARQIEIWDRDPFGPGLVFQTGESIWGDDLESHYAKTQISPREGLLGRALFSGVPGLSTDLRRDAPVNPESELSQGIAIPVIQDGRCRALVALYS